VRAGVNPSPESDDISDDQDSLKILIDFREDYHRVKDFCGVSRSQAAGKYRGTSGSAGEIDQK
jgi:hypothetical protein